MENNSFLRRPYLPSVLKRGLLYARTIYYLKPIQVFYRIKRIFFKPKVSELAEIRKNYFFSARTAFILKASVEVRGTRFKFIGQEFDISETGWDCDDIDKLWRYNLHYFDFLNSNQTSFNDEYRKSIINIWLEENPPFIGTAWEPYPLSLRIVNWIKYFFTSRWNDQKALHSLYIQARWLRKNIEYHLLGNHIFANGKALYFAGMFFSGDEADEWKTFATKLLRKQIGEQVLSDGGHFELSPMYHSIALEDMLDIVNISKNHSLEEKLFFEKTIGGMLEWLRGMLHPDDDVSFFNDCALQISATYNELFNYASRLSLQELPQGEPGSRFFEDTGYVRLQNKKTVVICDVGHVGPSYIPGHAHADTLSFEMSIFGDRVFVNSGISTYNKNKVREAQRSTRLHNTVVVNDSDSSEVWDGFRVARRAAPLRRFVSFSPAQSYVDCSHDGYCRFDTQLVHRRRWELSENKLVITDLVGGYDHDAVASLYCHPDLRVRLLDGSVLIECRSGRVVVVSTHDARLAVEDATWHPSFGVSIPNRVIRMTDFGNQCRVNIEF